MRLKLAIVSVLAVLFTMLAMQGILSVSAQTSTPIPCEPGDALANIGQMDTFATHDKQADLSKLLAVKAMIDSYVAACKTAGLTPIPTDTPTLPEGVTATATVTLSAAQMQGATRTAVADSRTATQSVRATTQAMLAQYKPIDRRELTSYADKHVGEKVIVQGSIFNIRDGGTYVQIFMNGSYTDPLVLYMAAPLTGVYQGDYITAYGTVYGSYSFEGLNGNTLIQPRLDDVFLKPTQ